MTQELDPKILIQALEKLARDLKNAGISEDIHIGVIVMKSIGSEEKE